MSFWHIASFRCYAAIRQLRGQSGRWRGVSPAVLWVHGPNLHRPDEALSTKRHKAAVRCAVKSRSLNWPAASDDPHLAPTQKPAAHICGRVLSGAIDYDQNTTKVRCDPKQDIKRGHVDLDQRRSARGIHKEIEAVKPSEPRFV
jgi:hypothetical protein